MNGRVYDAFMPILWRVRSFVCLLLTVSTVIGAVAPAHACACATPAKTPSAPLPERVAIPAPAAKSCCQPGAKKRSCCSPASTSSAKVSCCDDQAPPAGKPGKSSPAPTPADAPGCHCLRCDCETQSVPPAPAVPVTAPVTPDLDGPDSFSPIPVVLMAEPPTATSLAVRLISSIPPTDLVISLSRLTC